MKPIKENKYQKALDLLTSIILIYVKDENKHLAFGQISTLRKLIDNYECLHNEFCLRCGNYKESHLGKCDGCRWIEDSK